MDSGGLSIQALEWCASNGRLCMLVESIEMGNSMSLKVLQKQSQGFM